VAIGQDKSLELERGERQINRGQRRKTTCSTVRAGRQEMGSGSFGITQNVARAIGSPA